LGDTTNNVITNSSGELLGMDDYLAAFFAFKLNNSYSDLLRMDTVYELMPSEVLSFLFGNATMNQSGSSDQNEAID